MNQVIQFHRILPSLLSKHLDRINQSLIWCHPWSFLLELPILSDQIHSSNRIIKFKEGLGPIFPFHHIILDGLLYQNAKFTRKFILPFCEQHPQLLSNLLLIFDWRFLHFLSMYFHYLKWKNTLIKLNLQMLFIHNKFLVFYLEFLMDRISFLLMRPLLYDLEEIKYQIWMDLAKENFFK